MNPSSMNPDKNLIYSPTYRFFAVRITKKERKRERTTLFCLFCLFGGMSLPIVQAGLVWLLPATIPPIAQQGATAKTPVCTYMLNIKVRGLTLEFLFRSSSLACNRNQVHFGQNTTFRFCSFLLRKTCTISSNWLNNYIQSLI